MITEAGLVPARYTHHETQQAVRFRMGVIREVDGHHVVVSWKANGGGSVWESNPPDPARGSCSALKAGGGTSHPTAPISIGTG